MLSRYFKRITIKIKSKESRGIRFFVPFVTLTEAYSDFVDFVYLISCLLPGVRINTGGKVKLSLKDIANYLRLVEDAIDEIIAFEAFDLVDVTTLDADVKIRVE